MTTERDPGAGAKPPRILILGVGNLLLRDDGIGVHLINELRGISFPVNITLIEAGTVSHQLIPMFHETDYLIVLDAVDAGDTPGSIYRFSPDDMNFPSERKMSLHEITLIDILQMAEMTGAKPETIILGVQPKDTSPWSLELSDEVKAAIPKVKELVIEEMKRIKKEFNDTKRGSPEVQKSGSEKS